MSDPIGYILVEYLTPGWPQLVDDTDVFPIRLEAVEALKHEREEWGDQIDYRIAEIRLIEEA